MVKTLATRRRTDGIGGDEAGANDVEDHTKEETHRAPSVKSRRDLFDLFLVNNRTRFNG